MCSPFLSTPDLAIQIISSCASRHGYIHHAARHTSFAFHGIHVSYVRSRILASLDTPLSLIFWLSTICAAQHYPMSYKCELHALQRQSPIPTQAFLGHTSPLHITLDTYFSLAAAQLVGVCRHTLGFSVKLPPYAIEHNSTFSFKLQPSYPTDFKIYITASTCHLSPIHCVKLWQGVPIICVANKLLSLGTLPRRHLQSSRSSGIIASWVRWLKVV